MKLMTKLILLVAGIIAGGLVIAVLVATNVLPFGPPVSTKTEDRSSQVIQAIERKEEVVLLSLGIQGIETRESSQEWIFGVIPGSERATFIQYRFHAKLGINGSDVTITPNGENAFHIDIPKFLFIGHQDPTFELVTERNGILSWVTPSIDPIEMVNNILNSEAKQGYIDFNEAILKDQARAFYSGIILGIDPTINVSFTFAD